MASINLSCLGIISLALVLVGYSTVLGQEFLLEGIRVTNWGTWGDLKMCNPGSYVYGMRLKVEEDQGFFGDDSALNGIELLCISPMAKRPAKNASIDEFSSITSLVGHKGSYGPIMECPEPGFAVGYQLKSEKDQGFATDDTAANNLRLFCSTGLGLEGYGRGWGDWTAELKCPRGLKLCGIQTQVEGSNSDDTTLNNVNMACCT